MNSITSPQLAAMLVISDIFALVCYNGGLSAYTAVGLVSGIALQYVMVMPLVKAADKGKTLPKAVKLLLVSGLVLWGGALLGGLWKAADITFVPYENAGGFPGKLEITAMVAAVSLYVAYEGTKAAARSSLIAAFTGVIFLLTDLISGMRLSNFGNIPAAAQFGTFMDGLRLSFLGGGNLITFIALLPCVKGRKIKAASLYFLCRGILSAAVVMTAVLVTGGIMDTADFPVIMSAQLSQPLFFTAYRCTFPHTFCGFRSFRPYGAGDDCRLSCRGDIQQIQAVAVYGGDSPYPACYGDVHGLYLDGAGERQKLCQMRGNGRKKRDTVVLLR